MGLKKYTLHFLHYGWEEELFSNNIDELISAARRLIRKNTGKPLIIKNDKGEIVREFTPRLHNFNKPKYSDGFKDYRETMREIEENGKD